VLNINKIKAQMYSKQKIPEKQFTYFLTTLLLLLKS